MLPELQVLTKTLLPLPDKWHGLADIEKRYRQRYIDMIVTDGTRDTFRARSKIVSAIRRHLEDKDFLEVGLGVSFGFSKAALHSEETTAFIEV